jgi:hypothetical protein
VLDVQLRGDAPIDLGLLDQRDLRVTGPNGFLRYAKFSGVISTNSDGTLITARYKLIAPGGVWDAADNGTYSIRLQDRAVGDEDADLTGGRTLGSFVVNVA